VKCNNKAIVVVTRDEGGCRPTPHAAKNAMLGLGLEKITKSFRPNYQQNYQIAYEAPILGVYSPIFYINELSQPL
jgi:hypothetical protein